MRLSISAEVTNSCRLLSRKPGRFLLSASVPAPLSNIPNDEFPGFMAGHQNPIKRAGLNPISCRPRGGANEKTEPSLNPCGRFAGCDQGFSEQASFLASDRSESHR